MPPVLIAAALTSAAVVGSAVIQSSSNKSAANATQKAADTATNEQRRQFDTSRADQMPWLTTGSSALSKLAGLYGLDTFSAAPGAPGGPGNAAPGQPQQIGTTPGGAMQGGGQPIYGPAPGGPAGGTVTPGTQQPGADPNADFFKSPDYQFRLSEGIRGVDAGAAARGALDSGGTRKAEIRYASNLAAGEFNNYAERLARIAGVGSNTATNLAGQGADYAKTVGNYAIGQGNSRASSYAENGQNYGNAIGDLERLGSGLIVNGRPATQPLPFAGGYAPFYSTAAARGY